MSLRVALAIVERRAGSGAAADAMRALARLLRERGEEVTIVCLGAGDRSAGAWQPIRASLGIGWISIAPEEPRPERWPYLPPLWLSERAADVLRGFDVVYADGAENPAFHLVRSKRFTVVRRPICVTVLDGGRLETLSSEKSYARIPMDLHVDFLERYAARHSDFVAVPRASELEAARRREWRFASEPVLLGDAADGSSASAWLAFHARVREAFEAAEAVPAAPPPGREATVDVCVTYYDKARHFPQLLESLTRQTWQGFHVIAVDDGSPDPEARARFDELAAAHASRGWTFFRQANAWVDAARNRAAAQGRGEYVLIVDADDVLAPHAVERLLAAALRSGADCLVSRSCLFAGDAYPLDRERGTLAVPLFARCDPLGADVLGGLFDPSVYGGPAILIRRAVFEALGGYRERRGSAHEDWELHARLALGGWATDVVPEDLHFYRMVGDGLASTTDEFLAKQRIVETYDRRLAGTGLDGLAAATYALHRRSLALEKRLRALEGGTGESEGSELERRLRAHAADDEGPIVVRSLRRVYRKLVPLDRRLRIDDGLRRVLGRPSRSAPSTPEKGV